MNTTTTPTNTQNEVASSEQRVAGIRKPAKPAPMTDERIMEITNRLRHLSDEDESSAIWQTIGGMQSRVVNQPHTPARAFFDILEARINEIEAKRRAA